MTERPARGVELDTCCMVEVDPERFEMMVSEALDGIPTELGELMSNVAVTVQHDSGPAGLLGLYQGVPLTRRAGSADGHSRGGSSLRDRRCPAARARMVSQQARPHLPRGADRMSGTQFFTGPGC